MSVRNSILVSIVVPVYNVEKYLDACISSIRHQKYTCIEIILIDDGSTDTSGQICDEYAKKDSRIKVIHNTNRGVSNARNHGIRLATGKYITFIDSDDTISPYYLDNLITPTFNKNYDIIMCGINYLFVKEHRTHSDILSKNEFLTGKIQNDYTILSRFLLSSCLKLYKLSLIKKYNIFFREEFLTAEDQIFNQDLFQYVQSYVFINKALYNYFIRGTSSLSHLIEINHLKNDIDSLSLKKDFFIKLDISNRNQLLADYAIFLIQKYISSKQPLYKNYQLTKKLILGIKVITSFENIKSSIKRNIIYFFLGKNILLPVYFYFWIKDYYKRKKYYT